MIYFLGDLPLFSWYTNIKFFSSICFLMVHFAAELWISWLSLLLISSGFNFLPSSFLSSLLCHHNIRNEKKSFHSKIVFAFFDFFSETKWTPNCQNFLLINLLWIVSDFAMNFFFFISFSIQKQKSHSASNQIALLCLRQCNAIWHRKVTRRGGERKSEVEREREKEKKSLLKLRRHLSDGKLFSSLVDSFWMLATIAQGFLFSLNHKTRKTASG